MGFLNLTNPNLFRREYFIRYEIPNYVPVKAKINNIPKYIRNYHWDIDSISPYDNPVYHYAEKEYASIVIPDLGTTAKVFCKIQDDLGRVASDTLYIEMADYYEIQVPLEKNQYVSFSGIIQFNPFVEPERRDEFLRMVKQYIQKSINEEMMYWRYVASDCEMYKSVISRKHIYRSLALHLIDLQFIDENEIGFYIRLENNTAIKTALRRIHQAMLWVCKKMDINIYTMEPVGYMFVASLYYDKVVKGAFDTIYQNLKMYKLSVEKTELFNLVQADYDLYMMNKANKQYEQCDSFFNVQASGKPNGEIFLYRENNYQDLMMSHSANGMYIIQFDQNYIKQREAYVDVWGLTSMKFVDYEINKTEVYNNGIPNFLQKFIDTIEDGHFLFFIGKGNLKCTNSSIKRILQDCGSVYFDHLKDYDSWAFAFQKNNYNILFEKSIKAGHGDVYAIVKTGGKDKHFPGLSYNERMLVDIPKMPIYETYVAISDAHLNQNTTGFYKKNDMTNNLLLGVGLNGLYVLKLKNETIDSKAFFDTVNRNYGKIQYMDDPLNFTEYLDSSSMDLAFNDYMLEDDGFDRIVIVKQNAYNSDNLVIRKVMEAAGFMYFSELRDYDQYVGFIKYGKLRPELERISGKLGMETSYDIYLETGNFEPPKHNVDPFYYYNATQKFTARPKIGFKGSNITIEITERTYTSVKSQHDADQYAYTIAKNVAEKRLLQYPDFL